MTLSRQQHDQPIIPVVAAVIRNSRGRILVAQRPEGGMCPLKWEFPGGKLHPGETPETCLAREIEEELGVRIIVEGICSVVNHSYPGLNILLLAYNCRILGGKIELREHREARWADAEELAGLDLAAADIPIAKRVTAEMKGGLDGSRHYTREQMKPPQR